MAERWLFAWGLGSVAFGGASLLVPLYVVQLGGTTVDLGLLFATSALIGAPGAIVFGRLADRTDHRRPLVLITLSVIGGALAVVPLLSDVAAIIVANAGLWLVVAAVSPVLTMLVVDDAPSRDWGERIGQLNKYQGVGWAGGLVFGAVWPLVARPFLGFNEATRALFWLLAGCAGLAALIAARTLPRPAPAAHVTDDRAVRRIARLMAVSGRGVKGATFVFLPNRLYWTTRGIRPRQLMRRLDSAIATYLLAAAMFFMGFAVFWAPLPLFFTEVGFDSGQIFGLYLASSVASAVLYEGAGRLPVRFDVRVVQSGTLVGRGLLFPAVALVGGIGAATVGLVTAGALLAFIGLTWAVIAVVGTAIVTRLAPPRLRGESLGLHTAIASVAGGIGGLLGGVAATSGYFVAFTLAGALVVAGAILVASLRVLSEDDPSPTGTGSVTTEATTAAPADADQRS